MHLVIFTIETKSIRVYLVMDDDDDNDEDNEKNS